MEYHWRPNGNAESKNRFVSFKNIVLTKYLVGKNVNLHIKCVILLNIFS